MDFCDGGFGRSQMLEDIVRDYQIEAGVIEGQAFSRIDAVVDTGGRGLGLVDLRRDIGGGAGGRAFGDRRPQGLERASRPDLQHPLAGEGSARTLELKGVLEQLEVGLDAERTGAEHQRAEPRDAQDCILGTASEDHDHAPSLAPCGREGDF